MEKYEPLSLDIVKLATNEDFIIASGDQIPVEA